jgi:hypothetical protein
VGKGLFEPCLIIQEIVGVKMIDVFGNRKFGKFFFESRELTYKVFRNYEAFFD